MSSKVHAEVTPPIATVRLDEPERHNVLDADGWRALAEAFDGLSEREDVTCVVLSGTGGPRLLRRLGHRGVSESAGLSGRRA